MSENKNKKMSPELRFPEFKKTDFWQEFLLGDIATFSKGKGISKSDVVSDGEIPCIRYGQLYTEYRETINEVVSHTNVPIEKLVLSQVDDVIIPASGETQIDIATASCVKKKGIALGGDLNIIRSKNDGTFLSYYLNSAKKHRIAQMSQGISVIHLYANQLKTLEVNLPSIEEQKKIAQFLSSVDEIILMQTKKIKALQKYKKGLIQQLFPAINEPEPKLRFPEFRKAGQWKEKPLKEVFSIFQGFAFSSKDSANEGVRWLKIADVSFQHMNHNSSSFLPMHFKNKHSKFIVKSGDYVMALTRPILGKKLKISRVDEVFDGALLNQRVGKLETNENPDFVYYLLQTFELISQVEKSIAGSEPPNLSAKQIEDINVYIPSKNEQKKIADTLLSLEQLMSLRKQEIDSLNQFKNGLMQQLFPNSGEADR